MVESDPRIYMGAEPRRHLDLSEIAQETLDTGWRALGGTLAGGAWVMWGLSVTQAVTAPATAAFILAASLLLICSGYCIVKGRALRKKHPFARRPLNKGFLMVTMFEAAGVAGVVMAAQKMARFDALPDWIGIVVGLHFLGLARVFRAPVYYATGVCIVLWCMLSWMLFRGNALVVAVGVGIGVILWATSSFNVTRVLARRSAGIDAPSRSRL